MVATPQPHTSLPPFQKVPFCEMKTTPSPASWCWVAALRLPFSKHHCLRKFSHPFLWWVKSQAKQGHTSSSSSAVHSHITSWGCTLAQAQHPRYLWGGRAAHPRSWTAPGFPVHCGHTCYLKADHTNKWSQLTAQSNNNSSISSGTI